MPKTYVVFVGRKPGVYDTWSEANAQVFRFSGACYQGYATRAAAEEAYNASLPKPVAVNNLNDFNCSSSTTTASSTTKTYQTKTLAAIVEEVSDLGRQNHNVGIKLEKLSEEIRKLLAEMENGSVSS